jgi:hypothetical protein
MDGNLPGLGLEGKTLHPQDVPQVQGLEQVIGSFPDCVQAHINLDPPLGVLKVGERAFAHAPDGHQPPREADLVPFDMFPHLQMGILLKDLGGMVGLGICGGGVGGNALFTEGLQLFQANLDEFIKLGQGVILQLRQVEFDCRSL